MDTTLIPPPPLPAPKSPSTANAAKEEPLSTEETPRARAKRYAQELAEPRTHVINIITLLIKRMGVAFCEAAMERTREIEANGGLWVAAEQRRRTPAGTFFVLCKDARPAARAIYAAQRRKKKPMSAVAPETVAAIPPPELPRVGSGTLTPSGKEGEAPNLAKK